MRLGSGTGLAPRGPRSFCLPPTTCPTPAITVLNRTRARCTANGTSSLPTTGQAAAAEVPQSHSDEAQHEVHPGERKGNGRSAVEEVPCLPLSYLDPKRPTHVNLLGMSLVLWSSTKGEWCCMLDRCPHRLAPLSEGRIEGDTLQCSYHGWKFSCSGACVHVPQIDDPKAHAAATASPRSGAQSLPTRVQHGLVWVFPRATAPEDSFPSDLGHLDGQRFTWNFRDMPLRWDTVLENVMDPSHVPHAHHGVQGTRDKPIVDQPMTPGKITRDGFSVDMGPAPAPLDSLRITAQWQPPFRYRVFLPGTSVSFENWVLPTKPGWCRFMSSLPHPPTLPGLPTSFADLKKRISIWFLKTFPILDHLYRLQVLDGDAVILHVAERELFRTSQGDWRRAYFMPASADKQVGTFRRWFDAYAQGMPTCSAEDVASMGPALPKEQILDRWQQHAKSCAHCLAALKALEFSIAVASAAGCIAAVTAVASLVLSTMQSAPPTDLAGTIATPSGTQAPMAFAQAASAAAMQAGVLTQVAVIAAAVTVALFLAVKALQRWQASYFYLGYDHALR